VLPTELRQLRACEGFAFNNNYLSGPLIHPDSSRFDFLYMYYNLLTGPVPESLFNLTTTRQILVQSNYFTGTLSPRITRLPRLTEFSVGSNLLSGSLPPGFATLSNLTLIDASANFFIGVSYMISLCSHCDLLIMEYLALWFICAQEC
jgi:Leucine-rich repeat (LRR) protein